MAFGVAGGGGVRGSRGGLDRGSPFFWPVLYFLVATACSIYAFRKLRAAASDEEVGTALALLCAGVLLYGNSLSKFEEIKEKRSAEMAEKAAREARAPCEKVRSKMIENVMGRIVHEPRDDGGRTGHFAIFDLNHDGKISKAEFILGVQALGVDLEDSTLQDCFHMFDTDHSGWLSPKEFAVFLASGYLPSEQGPKVEFPTDGKNRGKTKDRGNTDPSSTDLPGMLMTA